MNTNRVGQKCFVLADVKNPDGSMTFGVRMEGTVLNEDEGGFWIKRSDGHERRYRRSKVEFSK